MIRPTGPAPFVALAVFGVLFGGLTLWRLSTLTPVDDPPSRSTTSSVPVLIEPTPTEADKWCLLVRERAMATLRETSSVNGRDHDGRPVVTPHDIDPGAFSPDGFSWYLDEGTQAFYMDEETMPC